MHLRGFAMYGREKMSVKDLIEQMREELRREQEESGATPIKKTKNKQKTKTKAKNKPKAKRKAKKVKKRKK